MGPKTSAEMKRAIEMLRNNPAATVAEAARSCGVTTQSIYRASGYKALGRADSRFKRPSVLGQIEALIDQMATQRIADGVDKDVIQGQYEAALDAALALAGKTVIPVPEAAPVIERQEPKQRHRHLYGPHRSSN